jgi:hypothetical protein
MKTFPHFWRYLPKFFLEWECFRQICRSNQNTYFTFNNFFPKIAPFMRCRKIWWRLRSHKWSHNMAHVRCVLDYQDYMHVRACTRPRARVPTRTHKQTNEKYLLLFYDNNDSRTRLNVTLHVYCLLYLMLNRLIHKVTNGLETVKRVLKTVN